MESESRVASDPPLVERIIVMHKILVFNNTGNDERDYIYAILGIGIISESFSPLMMINLIPMPFRHRHDLRNLAHHCHYS